MKLHIMAAGRPAPQGSKGLGGAGQLLEVSPYLPAWRQAVKVAAYQALQRAGIAPEQLPLFPAPRPVTVELCTFFIGPEQCRAEGTEAPTGPPDIDKLLRAALDALGGQRRGSARIFEDDSQVTEVRRLSKVRADPPESTGMYLIISDEGK